MEKNLITANGMKIFLLLLVGVVLTNVVSAQVTTTNLTFSPDSIVQIQQLRYDPYPVSPGDYFDFWISVQSLQSYGAYNLKFVLDPTYPFSLDSNDSGERDFGPNDAASMVLHYKVRVDQNAVAGNNDLKLDYYVNGIEYTQTFSIDVENPQTTFDAVIQEISGSSVSIAIANTGTNTANSVIVKIPDQDSFIASGTNGQMVGNLNSGDYSIVGFTLLPKRSFSSTSDSTSQTASTSSVKGTQSSGSDNYQSQNTSLKFEIDYTDSIGVRRTVDMSLPLKLSPVSSSTSTTGYSSYGNFRGRQTSSWSVWYTVLIIFGVGGIILFIANKKNPKLVKGIFAKINPKNLFKKKKGNYTGELPDWIKNAKEKEKNK